MKKKNITYCSIYIPTRLGTWSPEVWVFVGTEKIKNRAARILIAFTFKCPNFICVEKLYKNCRLKDIPIFHKVWILSLFRLFCLLSQRALWSSAHCSWLIMINFMTKRRILKYEQNTLLIRLQLICQALCDIHLFES